MLARPASTIEVNKPQPQDVFVSSSGLYPFTWGIKACFNIAERLK